MSSAPHLKPLKHTSKPFSRNLSELRGVHTHCEIDLGPEIIQDIRSSIRAVRQPPHTYETSGSEHGGPVTEYGITKDWIEEAASKWLDDEIFNWPKIQSDINSVPHAVAGISYEGEEYVIHYAALWSAREDATGLIFIHGWPGCFLEFLPLMKLLKEKYDPETLPYHIIVPSMPGYTFSSGPPPTRDFSTRDTGEIFKILLSQLGFSQKRPYIVQGGDIGSRVARGLAVRDAACSAVHLNFCFDLPMKDYPREGLGDRESQGLQRVDEFLTSGTGYGIMHATRPSTTSIILSSSPMALLAWLAEKYLAWSNEPRLSLETILTFTTIYWVTDSLSRSIYPYRADFNNRDEVPAHGGSKWNIPANKALGFSAFPFEIMPVPRGWVERTCEDSTNMYWKSHDSGGHFAALERPKEMLEDLEEFVGHVQTKHR